MLRVIGGWSGTGQTGKAPTVKRDQKIGEYCGGKSLEKCKGYWGEGLALVCSTCPN